jgi:cytidylate kinase
MSVVTIVTGLPRSGTSLMMQLLNKSSLEILSDGIRQKDISNPEGYYELEAVKGIVRDNSFLKDATGKVVKIVAPLPVYLDKSLDYRIVFMRREIEEVLRSQEKMLNKDQASEREKFRTIYEMHLKKTYHFFESNSIPYIDIQYKQLLNESEQELKRLINFLELSTPIEELLSVIKVDLYRNKVN